MDVVKEGRPWLIKYGKRCGDTINMLRNGVFYLNCAGLGSDCIVRNGLRAHGAVFVKSPQDGKRNRRRPLEIRAVANEHSM
jgi:hypothetical protein